MAKHLDTGKQGEAIAAQYLLSQNYTLLEKNWRAGHLELDIIAKKEGLVIIAEVKTRTGRPQNYDPGIAVNRQKQRQLIRAANRYILSHHITEEVRFDIINIFINGQTHTVNHLKDAFYPTL